MITTANLGLIVWDNEEDDFEHSTLADNFVRIDQHNHLGGLSAPLEGHDELPSGHWVASLGLGEAIKTGAIEPEAIWRYLLKARAVGHIQIDKEGVESENIKKKNVLDEHIGDEQVKDRAIEEHTITIDKLDPNILTLGSIILWYKAYGGAEPGNIWQLCDGSSFAKGNKLGAGESAVSGNIPDLRKKFVRGTDLAGNGETGGNLAVDLSHHHNTSASSLDHTHTVGAHSHQIVNDGKHEHKFANGHVLHQRMNAFSSNLTIEGHWANLHSAYLATLEEPGQNEDVQADMDQNGLHNHGGNTGVSAAFATGGSSLGGSIATDTQLVGVDTTPPFVGLCYVMRVK
jgi:hypothetical protein